MGTREADEQKSASAYPNGAGTELPPSEPRSGPRKRVFFIALGAIGAALLLFWGVKWFLFARVHAGTEDAQIDAAPVAVTSRINDRIDRIMVSTNQQVHKGELLVVLDRAVEQDQLRSAQAQYDLARANQQTTTTQGQGGLMQAQGNSTSSAAQIPLAQAGVVEAQAQLSAAQAQLPAAQAAYARATADYRRTASLVSTGDEPRQELDAARATEADAAAQLRSARDQINVAQAGLLAARQKVDAAEADVRAAQGAVTTAQGRLAQSSDTSQVEAAKAQLAIARQNLSYTRIYSPINGYVGEKSAEVGQTVSPGMTVMTLIPSGPGQIYITADYKETELGDMRVGQPVDISVDAYKGVTFHGHVVSINPASQNTYALIPSQNATGNFVKVTQRIPVRISIDDMRASMPLRPGMSVETYVRVR
jgi:membrane fusion protein (multidrug efflux system)